MSIYCKNCGHPIPDNNRCCTNCGCARDGDNEISNSNNTYSVGNTYNTKIHTLKKGAFESAFDFFAKVREQKIIEDEKRRKRLEAEAKEDERKLKIILIIFAAFCLLTAICVLSGLGISSCIRNQEIEGGKIVINYNESDFKGENYDIVKTQLEIEGFTNIILIDLNDHGFLGLQEDKVKSVSVDGKTNYSRDDIFYPDVKIVITYY